MKSIKLFAPRVFIPTDSVDEFHLMRKCSDCLGDILSYFSSLNSAFQLSEYCKNYLSLSGGGDNKEQSDIFQSWRRIAVRDGAMSIFHFSKALGGVDNWSRRSILMKDRIDNDVVKQARKILQEKFPAVDAIRNSIAHSGEISANQKEIDKHLFTGSYESEYINIVDGKEIRINGVLAGNKMFLNWAGKINSYEMSLETVNTVHKVMMLYFSAYSFSDESWIEFGFC